MLRKTIISMFTKLCYLENQMEVFSETSLLVIQLMNTIFFIIYPSDNQLSEQQSGLRGLEVVFHHYLEHQHQLRNYILMLANIILISFGLLLCIINFNKKINLSKMRLMERYIVALFCRIWIWLYALNQILLVIGLQNLQNSISNSILYLIQMHFCGIIYFIVCGSSLITNTIRFKQIDWKFQGLLCYLLQQQQPYWYYFQRNSIIIIQSMLYLLIASIQFKLIFHDLLYPNKLQIRILILFYSLGSIISVCNILTIPHPLIKVLLIEPIIFYILISIWDEYMDSLAHNDKLSLKEINLRFCVNQKDNGIYRAIFLHRHKINCINVQCYCQFNAKIIMHSNQVKKAMKVQQLQEMRRNQTMKLQKHFYYNCHYISALRREGLQQDLLNKIENKQYKNSLNIFNVIKWNTFTYIIKQELHQQFQWHIQHEEVTQTNLATKVLKFMKIEEKNRDIRSELELILENKIQFLQQIKFLRIDQLLDKLYLEEQKLLNLYQQYPNHRNQSVLIFYYAEILNDWYKAYDFANQSAINEYTHQDLSFLQNEMSYIIFSYENTNLMIRQYSDSVIRIFGYSYREFMAINPEQLIPNCIREIHNEEIERFFNSGVGTYFRRQGINVGRHNSGYIQPISFFFDICFDSDQYLKFIAFIGQTNYYYGIIILDQNGLIQGINRELLGLINYTEKQIQTISIEQALNNIPFNSFLRKQLDQSKWIIRLPIYSVMQQLTNSSLQQKINLLAVRSNCNNYEVEAEFTHKRNYSIFKIITLQEYDSVGSVVKLPLLKTEEEEDIILPYEYNYFNEYRIFVLDTQRQEIQQENMLEQRKSEKIQGKLSEDDEIIKNIDALEQCSIHSTLQGLRNSINFKKYYLFNQLTVNKSLGRFIPLIILFITLSIIFQLIFLIITYYFIEVDLQYADNFYQSIQINHYFMEPFHKFFLTRYTIQDYFSLKYYGNINDLEYNFYFNFTQPNLIHQYVSLRDNFQIHFSDELFQPFINDNYVSIKLQIIHQTPIELQQFNITLRSAFSILLEALYKQYLTYFHIGEGTILGVSPHQTFQYVNYILFVKVFDDISTNVYIEALNQQEMIISRMKNSIYPTIIIVLVFQLISVFYLYKFIHSLEKLKYLCQHIEKQHIQSDIKRLTLLNAQIKQSQEYLHTYKFNLVQKENICLQKQQFTQQKYQIESKLYKIILFVPIILLILQNLLIRLTINYMANTFVGKFSETITLVKYLSDVGVYLPAAFSQKEILYFWTFFSYLTEQDKEQFKSQVLEGIGRLNLLNTYQLKEEYQFSNDFHDYFRKQGQSNLCTLLNSSDYVNFDYFCNNSKKGLLKLGLLPTLIEFTNQLRNEYDQQFLNRSQPPKEELEAVYLCSDAISKLINQMSADIEVQSKKQKFNLQLISIIAMIFVIILFLLTIFLGFRILKTKLMRAKRIIYVIPQETLLGSPLLEREIRRISILEYFM